MSYRVLYGDQFDEEFLKDVLAIDEIVYAADGYVGELCNMVARYQVERRQFVCIWDEEQQRLAGYINFFPCSQGLYEDIRYQTEIIRDDDIRPDEMMTLQQGNNHLFIISIATHPEYRDKSVIKDLSNAWIDYLIQLEQQGYHITDIAATAVSPDGQKALRRYRFEKERVLKKDGNIVFVCEGDNLRKLLEKDLCLHGK